MATGLILTVAQTLVAALDSTVLRDICSMFGYKSELEKLKGTVSTISNVLLDAEAKREELSHEAQDWIHKLKDALYDVEDLLDEFNTITQQQQRMDGSGNKISKKVQHFFSRSNQLIVAFSMSLDIRKIKQRLDAIASSHKKFGFSVDHQPRRRRQEETCSHVYEERIVGRDGDKDALVGVLLDSNVEDVSFVTIIGMGGLGKTTVAQLVYNDDRIKSLFQLRMWVCVSEEFDMKQILGQMLMSATNKKCDELTMELLQRKFLEEIGGKRYFLVLDDVWEKAHENWVDLRDFLVQGGRGSKILITSRSKEVARAIGNCPMYELQGLSKEASWRLFQQMAFETCEEQDSDLLEIGKDIVHKCAYVPLSIRVIGSLLYGQDRSKWLLFQKNDLVKIQEVKSRTMATLKFSYYNLTTQLKSCFSYCALFPKDHVIEKESLINLWMANECIVPKQDVGQSIEDVAEECFSILLQRCFFQDTEKDDCGEIVSCKVHDLMHDLATEVAGHESLILSHTASQFDGRIRHLSIPQSCPIFNSPHNFVAKLAALRTFLQIQKKYHTVALVSQSNAVRVLSDLRGLRLADLSVTFLTTIPSSICRLVHLRCLDLSHTRLETLPKSITKLHNLQVLKLVYCMKLHSLPEHFSRLVNLRHLDIDGCHALTHMPSGMKNLTCLYKLTMFVVGGDSKEVRMGQLEDLKALINLRGELTIKVVKSFTRETLEAWKGVRLLSRPLLKDLCVKFEVDDQGQHDVQEALLESLHPNPDLRRIKIDGYQGTKLPGWASWGNAGRISLPSLVRMNLYNLPCLRELPSLSRLYSLKKLELENIPNLEYIEGDAGYVPSTLASSTTDLTVFPSLEGLRLEDLQKLKGWWRDDAIEVVEAHADDVGSSSTREQGDGNGHGIPSSLLFPSLCQLIIEDCPNMKSFPSFPHVKDLTLIRFNEELVFRKKRATVDNHVHTTELSTNAALSADIDVANIAENSAHLVPPVFPLVKLRIDNVGFMRRLHEDSSRGVVHLEIEEYEAESLLTARDVLFHNCAPSLQFLRISICYNLKSLHGGGIEHLTSLQILEIEFDDKLELEAEDENGMPWKSLHSLSSLCLWGLPKLINLPKGLQYLTALQSLTINSCENLSSLPEWLGCFTSLRSLEIYDCSKLTRLPEAMRNLTSLIRLQIWKCPALIDRCRSPNGNDWPKIQNIPNFDFAENAGKMNSISERYSQRGPSK